jgi:hypothetical protein
VVAGGRLSLLWCQSVVAEELMSLLLLLRLPEPRSSHSHSPLSIRGGSSALALRMRKAMKAPPLAFSPHCSSLLPSLSLSFVPSFTPTPLLYSTPLYSTLRYTTALHSTLLYSTLFFSCMELSSLFSLSWVGPIFPSLPHSSIHPSFDLW